MIPKKVQILVAAGSRGIGIAVGVVAVAHWS